MSKMKDERLPNRDQTKKQGGCRKLGRLTLQLTLDDCLKADIEIQKVKKSGDKRSITGAMEENNKSNSRPT